MTTLPHCRPEPAGRPIDPSPLLSSTPCRTATVAATQEAA